MISARPIHKESVCCCCGRSMPGITPVIFIDGVDNFRPMVFCRRCFKATFWGDSRGLNGSTQELPRARRQDAVACRL